jgi:hypothetical protein
VSTATTTNGKPKTTRDPFLTYCEKGVFSLPVPHREKNVGALNGENYQDLRLTPHDLDAKFPEGKKRNIAALLGAASGNLADIDLDCKEAIVAGRRFLPRSNWVFGRKSARASHHEYRVIGALETHQFRDVDRSVIAELRYSGTSIYPPSFHRETGEVIMWERFGDELTEVTADVLYAAVARVAAAAILAIHWPEEGGRQDAAQHLAGGLLRAGRSEDDTRDFILAVAEAAGDDEAKQRASTVKPTAKKLAADKSVTGWPSLVESVGKDVVERVRDWLKIGATPAVLDVVVPTERPWPAPPADEAFYGLPGRIVAAIDPATESDRVAILGQTLIHFGNVIARNAHFVVEGTPHYTNEFVVLVGRTSKARKGTSYDRVRALFLQATGDDTWGVERVQTGLSSGEGVVWAVRDRIIRRERQAAEVKGQPPTYVEVEVDPGVSDKRLLVVESEFANVLKMIERQGNVLSVILRQSFDGAVIQTLTKNSPAKSTGAHLSLIGHITEEEFCRSLTGTEAANGFMNRFLPLCVDRSKVLPFGGQVDPTVTATLAAELGDAIRFAKGVGLVVPDEGARAVWIEVYPTLSQGRPGLCGALLGRAEAHAMRLAMLFALMDQSSVIRSLHLMAALSLWDYCERSVRRIFGDAFGDPVADDLLCALRASPGGMTRTEIAGHLGRHVPSERVSKALGTLSQHELVRSEKRLTGGAPEVKWFAIE